MKTLKNLIIVAVSGMMALGITGCTMLGSVVTGVQEVSKEAEEIASGKVFTVEKGVVTYNDGTILTFKDFGKVWKVQTEGALTIANEDDYYVIDLETNTGYRTENYEGFSGCPFIFWEKLYEFGDGLGAEIKKSKATIAGKKCSVFTGEDGAVVAGWERVLFKSDEIEAESWKDKVDSDAFSVDGYTIEEY